LDFLHDNQELLLFFFFLTESLSAQNISQNFLLSVPSPWVISESKSHLQLCDGHTYISINMNLSWISGTSPNTSFKSSLRCLTKGSCF
jgi:hypothetical protein